MSWNRCLRPAPWCSLGRANPELARLFDATYRQRRRLSAWYPSVPAPPARIAGLGRRNDNCYPVGGLILLWNSWGYFRGACPDCGGRGLGVSAAGGLSTGRVIGVCRRCGALLERFVPGIGTIIGQIGTLLAGTPYQPAGPAAATSDWAPTALVAVLRELGEGDLPDPHAPGLLDPGGPTQRTR